MNRAFARSRISLSVVQALLGLIVLAWLPAIDRANAGTSFLVQFEETLLLTDDEASDRDTCPDRSEGGSDDLVPSVISCRPTRTEGGPFIRFDRQPSVDLTFLGVLRATGPPQL